MALKIIKLAVNLESQVDTSPMVSRFFYEVENTVEENTSLKIDASQFLDDAGNEVVSLPMLNLNNGYFNVYINGMLQMEENFAYTGGEQGDGNLLVMVPEGSEIYQGTSIILEVLNFSPLTVTRVRT
ncbi:DUF4183 domain-containing protein [Niallia sp. 03133]|uniref:DUF4183 domain-containing protein n=1 Tax=Niallia sp. 03133 TaxID=3458060 RepID=UPI004043E7D1